MTGRGEFITRDTRDMTAVALAQAATETFAGYFVPISHTPEGFAAFCRWFSLDTARSIRLETKEGRLAGLAMLGIRGDRGWCGPFGILPQFRGRGLSALLADTLAAQARSLGLRSMHLEVLVQNERAVHAYRRAGFAVMRDLTILAGEPDMGVLAEGREAGLVINAVSVEEAWHLASRLGNSPAPTWQRQGASLLVMEEMQARIGTQHGEPVAALIFRPNAAGQWAINGLAFKEERAALALLPQSGPLFCLNEPPDSRLHALLRRLGLRETYRQHEMVLSLSED